MSIEGAVWNRRVQCDILLSAISMQLVFSTVRSPLSHCRIFSTPQEDVITQHGILHTTARYIHSVRDLHSTISTISYLHYLHSTISTQPLQYIHPAWYFSHHSGIYSLITGSPHSQCSPPHPLTTLFPSSPHPC